MREVKLRTDASREAADPVRRAMRGVDDVRPRDRERSEVP
jgi:hypothetical protein